MTMCFAARKKSNISQFRLKVEKLVHLGGAERSSWVAEMSYGVRMVLLKEVSTDLLF